MLAVELHEDEKQAIVKVPADQLSLAIGKRGQNVRLAAKLTGWRIDVMSPEEEAPAVEAEKAEESAPEAPEAAPAAEEVETE